MTGSGNPGVLEVGRELDHHGNIRGPVGVPVSEIDRHLLITGATGSGKSTTAIRTIQTGHHRTEGATIAIDPKGDWATQLLRHHFATAGTLDDVWYFDVGTYLPALSFFDLRQDIAADRQRGQAMREIIDHFFDILAALMPAESTAVRSPDVIKYIIMALFDPIQGSDAFTLETLAETLYELRRSRELPPVSIPETESLLQSITDAERQMFDTILQGSLTRVEKFYGNGYLRPVFNHIPEDPEDAFTFEDFLNRDTLLIFDLGDLPSDGQRVIANMLLSLLWRGLKRRFTAPDTALKQTLLFVDEVPQLQIHNRLIDLLSLSRGYQLGVIPMMQSPAQLRSRGNQAAFEEILNNCRSILAGQVADTSGLASRLSGSTISEAEVQNRLLNLKQDRWLFSPATPRDVATIPTHLIADIDLPAGLPGSEESLSFDQLKDFKSGVSERKELTENHYAIPYEPYTEEAVRDSPALRSDPTVSKEAVSALQDANFATTLPLWDEFPGQASFDFAINAFVCEECGGKRSPDFGGLKQAINCHGSLDDLDRQAIAPVELQLALSETEILDAPVSLRPLIWLQVLTNITKDRYSRMEFDPVLDNLKTLRSRFGITDAHIDELESSGLIRKENIREHEFLTVTVEGRDLLDEPNRRDIEWGHGKGDINESYLHRVMVSALYRYIRREFEFADESPVTQVIPYYEPDRTQVLDLHANVRFDVVGLDDSSSVVVIGEAERPNNDQPRNVAKDYREIAAAEPEEAIWLAPSDATGHEAILDPLSNPEEYTIDSPSEIEVKEYSSSTRLKDINGLDSPGITDILTLRQVRNLLEQE